MLGLRKYRSTAIDVWCGAIKNFAADVVGDQLISSIEKTAQMANGHLAYTPNSLDLQQADQLMQTIQESLDQNSIRRLSLVVPDLDQYENLQAALLAHFPE